MSAIARHWHQLKPAEHGAWPLLLTPFLIGVGLAAATGRMADRAALALLLVALLALAVFLIRQPLGALARIWRGRARRGGATLPLRWALVLAGVSVACGLGLLALGRDPLLVLALPAGVTLLASLLIQALVGPRGLLLEIVGVLGLALTAPAAYLSLTGRLDGGALAAWAISAAHSIISILYVRLRVATRRDRVSQGARTLVVGSHLAAFVGMVAAAAVGMLPRLAALPFGLLLVRALWVALRAPRLEDVRRFGFTEMGLSVAFAALVVLAYFTAL